MSLSAPAGPLSGHRDRFIDGMRGASALAVMLFHFNAGLYYPEVKFWHGVAGYGYLGVVVFFVLSGYCIGQSWLKGAAVGAFFRRRFWRIYPAYLASLGFIVLCALARKQLGGINDVARLPTRPGQILAVLTLCTRPASAVPTINWVYWSLTYEVFFYLIMGLTLGVPAVVRRRQTLLGLHLVFCGLSLTGARLAGTPLFFVDEWNLFALGIGTCMVSARAREAPRFLAVSAATLAAKIALGRFAPYDLAALVAAFLLLLPHRYFAPGPRHPLVLAGRISYSVYLLHVPIGLFVFMRLVRPWIADSPGRFALMQVAGAALVFAAATLSFRFFEKPFLSRRSQPTPIPS